MVTFFGEKNMNLGYGVFGIVMQNYYAFNDGNSNTQLLYTHLTLKLVCNLSDQKNITNFILRMSNVI